MLLWDARGSLQLCGCAACGVSTESDRNTWLSGGASTAGDTAAVEPTRGDQNSSPELDK